MRTGEGSAGELCHWKSRGRRANKGRAEGRHADVGGEAPVEGTASTKVLREVLALRSFARGEGVPVWLEWGQYACRCRRGGQ